MDWKLLMKRFNHPTSFVFMKRIELPKYSIIFIKKYLNLVVRQQSDTTIFTKIPYLKKYFVS